MKSLTVGILKTSQSEKFKDELISSLKDNLEGIDEIIFTGSQEELDFGDIPVKYLNLNTDNKAVMRNSIIDSCKSDYILWLSDSSELDFDFTQELSDTMQDYPNIDIYYPNEVIVDVDGKEHIKKYDDYYLKEFDLLRILQIEKSFPEYGVVTKKDIFSKFGKFDENFEDYEFYDFLWKNTKNISLKQIKFAFVINKHTDTFIDTSYASLSLRKNIKNYNLEDLFPSLSWNKNHNLALATAYQLIGDILSSYYDLYNASDFYRKAAISFHNKISVQKIIDTYYNMGLFDEAIKLIREDQGFNEEEIREISSKINQIKSLVENIENSITEGKIKEIFEVINDIYTVYKGAPVLNIIGVIEYLGGNKENAYKFFYKAATLNPLADDILGNLVDISKELGKEDKVKGLIGRLLG